MGQKSVPELNLARRREGKKPDPKRIIEQADYYILDRCASHDEIYPEVREAFFAGVRELAGPAAEAAVRRDGLAKLHLHFPTERVLYLESFVETRLRKTLYKWSVNVGRDDLGIKHPFYVDHLIVIRIHFPFEIARRAKSAARPKRPLSDTLAHGVSALRNPRILVNQLSRAIRRPRRNSAYKPESFHGDLAKPARSHGAHIDTWYGHSFDGINLWWSIEGVNALNSVILYPDSIGRPLNYDPRSMYLTDGIAVPEPTTIDLKPGALLLFNPEMLHSTHVNVSDDTRVALTTRINPGRPRFNDEAPFNFEHWHLSTDVERGRYAALKVFPAAKNRGEPTIAGRSAYQPANSLMKRIDAKLADGEAVVCQSGELKPGVKLSVDFEDAKLVLARTKDGELKAWSRLCPHVGVDMADGWHDETKLHCPGHGLTFDWSTGKSACSSMKLRSFDVSEAGGGVRVRMAARAAAAPSELATC